VTDESGWRTRASTSVARRRRHADRAGLSPEVVLAVAPFR
jgi:hypothetical protein